MPVVIPHLSYDSLSVDFITKFYGENADKALKNMIFGRRKASEEFLLKYP
jgi:hypothetical protein